jgi:AcrR family transcriptional regulator
MPRVILGIKKRRRAELSLHSKGFSDRSYDQITIENIGHRLRVNKGALYLYFKNKEELL